MEQRLVQLWRQGNTLLYLLRRAEKLLKACRLGSARFVFGGRGLEIQRPNPIRSEPEANM